MNVNRSAPASICAGSGGGYSNSSGVLRAPGGFVDAAGWARTRSGYALAATTGLMDACGTLAERLVTLPTRTSRPEVACGENRPPCTSCHDRVAALFAANSHKFFHWVVESLPRLASVLALLATERDGGASPVRLLVSCKSRYARESIELLGLPSSAVLCRRDKVTYSTAKQLLWPLPSPCGGVRLAALRSLRTALPPPLRPAQTGVLGTVLVHKRQQHRRLTNHDEVVFALREALPAMLREFDGVGSLRDQITAFRGARCQVGPHGAGLSLMVFAPADFGTAEVSPGAYFVRLAGKPGLHLNRNRNRSAHAFGGEPNACYRGLADTGLGQRYAWLLVAGATANSDLTPDVDGVVEIARHACNVVI